MDTNVCPDRHGGNERRHPNMSIRFSTSDFHEGTRFRVHLETIEDVYRLKLDRQTTAPLCAGAFNADITGVQVGDVTITTVHGAAHRIRHLTRTAPHGGGYLQFNLVRSGTGVLRQDGREAAVGAGDLFLYETHRPFDLTYASDFEVCVISVPQELLARDLPLPGAVTARAVHHDSPMGLLVNRYFDGLLPQLGHVSDGTSAHLANASLQLLAGAVGELDTVSGTQAPSRERMRIRAQQMIEDHLHEGDLNVKRLAEHLRVSTSYLRALFAGSGETAGSTIARRRLERCRSALADPLQAARSISEIAFDCGFNSLSHLSHCFSAAYGMPPSEYRQSVRPQPTGAGWARADRGRPRPLLRLP